MVNIPLKDVPFQSFKLSTLLDGLSIIKMFIVSSVFYNRISNEDNKKTKFYRWAIKAFDNSDLMNPGGK